MRSITRGKETVMSTPNPFGIVPPMITPFRADQTIDEESLRREARYLIEQALMD
jgi:dihydrodipicolinate synthase/N-acetylneuraminate lyase